MARPRKEPTEQKDIVMSFRVSVDERLRIEEKATNSHVSTSDYLRDQALHGKVVVSQQTSLDPALFSELRRMGVNLNQLTRLAHTKQAIPAQVKRLCETIEAILANEVLRDGSEDR